MTLTEIHILKSSRALTLSGDLIESLNLKKGAVWPRLKFDIFMSKKITDDWGDKLKAIGVDPTNTSDHESRDIRWREIQETVVNFQKDSAIAAAMKEQR